MKADRLNLAGVLALSAVLMSPPGMAEAADSPPVAVDDAYTTPMNTRLVVPRPGVLANDYDLDGDPFIISQSTNPLYGQLALGPEGDFDYLPPYGFCGVDSFSYQLFNYAPSNFATVTITVQCGNQPPEAGDDAFTTDEDTPLTVGAPGLLLNDTDPDGDPLTTAGLAPPANGTVAVQADGGFTYTPDSNFCGLDAFTYTVADGRGGTDPGAVTVTVVCRNDPPVAGDDAYVTPEDVPLSVPAPGVLANDADVERDALAVAGYTQPANGRVVMTVTGAFTFTPAAGFCGADSFTYMVADGNGGADTGTVSLIVTCVHIAPASVNGDIGEWDLVANFYANLHRGGDVTRPVEAQLYLRYDCAAGTLYALVHTAGRPVWVSPGDAWIAIGTSGNKVTGGYAGNDGLPPDFQWVGPGYDGDPAHALGYEASFLIAPGSYVLFAQAAVLDNGPVTAATPGMLDTGLPLALRCPLNRPPDAVDDAYTLDEDTTLEILAPGVLANDTDPDGHPLTVNGSSASASGKATLNPAGDFVYTPDADFCGPDSFTYTVSDGNGGADTAAVTLTVACVNDPPVADYDSYMTEENTPLTIPAPGVLANDKDRDGDALTVVAFTAPYFSSATLSVNADGSFAYSPNADWCNPWSWYPGDEFDSFFYTVTDGRGGFSTAFVRVDLICTNDPLVAVDDAYATDEDVRLIVPSPGVLANDLDPDSYLEVFPNPSLTTANGASVTIARDGSFAYAPAADYCGVDNFTYTVWADVMRIDDTATVTITVACVNDPPTAADDAYAAVEDTPLTVPAPGLLANDQDVDGGPLWVMDYAQPAHGAATVDARGELIYTPAANYCGPDSFTYLVADGNGGTGTATAAVEVACVNDPPIPVGDLYTTDEDTVLVVPAPGLLANDIDVDGPFLQAIEGVWSVFSIGVIRISPDGSFTYKPAADFCGTFRFEYEITDGEFVVSGGREIITVACLNDPPVAADDAAATDENTPVVIAVLANDADADGDPLTVAIAAAPGQGTATANADGTVTYSPKRGFCGVDAFTYTVSDGAGGSATATATIRVTCVTGGLTVTKVVDWNGFAADPARTFEICVTGPVGFARCETVGALGGSFTLAGLLPGAYTVAETPPGGSWAAAGSGTVVQVVTAQTAVATVTNTLRLACAGNLDNFNRAPGSVGNNWQGAKSGYRIANNQLDVEQGGLLLWRKATFGPIQEACLTLAAIDPNGRDQGLLLKVNGSNPKTGAIWVAYDAPAQALQVKILLNSQWVVVASLPRAMASGDQLGARALADGRVTVYVNGLYVGQADTRPQAGGFYVNRGGGLGLYFANAANSLADDFGGGTSALP